MKQTFTPLFFNFRIWLKAFVLTAVLLSPVVVQAQTAEQIFRETVAANPLSDVNVYEANNYFDNDALTMSSNSTTLAAVANADPSSYTGASKANYVTLGSNRNFIIAGISTAKYTSVKLDFGVKVGSGTTVKVEYQADGGGWQTLAYTLPAPADGWRFITGETGVIPASSNIAVRFTASATNGRPTNLFIDDITLSGVYSPTEPEITGFNPASGGPGTEVTVYGYNLGSTYDIYLPASGSIALATYVSSDSIKFTVPADAETSLIELYDVDVNLLASTSTEFVVEKATVTSFTPAQGSPKPVGVQGDEVIITGTNLATATSVIFGGAGSAAPHFATDTEVRVYVPDGAETGALVVKTSDYGDATSSTTFTVLKPKITSLSKTSGKVGETVIIYGERLNVAPFSVTFEGGVTATVISESATELHVRVPDGAQTGLITVTTAEGTATSSTFTVLYPSITIQNTPLDPFATKAGVASEAQFYMISGSNLSENIIVKAPSTFQVSKDGATWASEITYAISGTGSVAQTPVYVRYFPTASGTHSGNITNSSSGLTELVAVSGYTLDPTITVTGTLSEFTTEVGTPSASQTYTVSGTNLEGDITVAGPASGEFKVSLDNTTFTRTVLVPLAAGATSIGETTIYVRYEPTEAGPHSANITQTSLNATDVTITASGNTSNSTLPVELISFKAEQKADEVTLLWATASEKDNSHFEVEMSANPEAGFTGIGKVNSKTGTSAVMTNYLLKYNLTNPGTHYFRLKQVDLDGTFAYSKVVAVEIAAVAESKVFVAPNPLNYNSKAFIVANAGGKANLVLHSMAGKQVYQKTVEVNKGQNEIQLPLYDKLPTGLYILTVELEGQRHQLKVVKQ